jgi:hypothetical protein
MNDVTDDNSVSAFGDRPGEGVGRSEFTPFDFGPCTELMDAFERFLVEDSEISSGMDRHGEAGGS